jgi:hypothetical protein
MITYNDEKDLNEPTAKGFFTDKDAAGFYEWCDWSAEKGLERLVFKVSRTPKYLQCHLERIYYCYQQKLDEQLYGALVDLLIVLHKGGSALGKRMVGSSKPRLTEAQYNTLMKHIDSKGVGSELLAINRYSVFARGLESCAVMVQAADDGSKQEQDPVDMAHNFIEYSDLDSAMQVLEEAILAQPERPELHHELLPLYRSTYDQARFKQVHGVLLGKGLHLPPEWAQLDDYFNSLN